jgi:D-alanyl-D-alanine carboxypeptidase/D-alanyl-D-alanine-endopeptidase (penicillin-binding protein 4)
LWRPQIPGYSVTNEVTTGAPGSTTNLSFSASPDGKSITVSGSIAADSQPVLQTSNIIDPDSFGRTALIQALQNAGVNVTADPLAPNPENELPVGSDYSGDPQVAAYVSPPYSQYAKLILKVSHNLGANLALCNMATFVGSSNCFDAFPIENKFLADVVLTTPDADAFRNSLPILGVNGSNAISCPDCPAKGKVFAKPGTVIGTDYLNNALAVADQSEAGYLKLDDGRTLIFVVLVNGAAAAGIPATLTIFNDTNQISALLWEEAEAHPCKCAANDKPRSRPIPDRSRAAARGEE